MRADGTAEGLWRKLEMNRGGPTSWPDGPRPHLVDEGRFVWAANDMRYEERDMNSRSGDANLWERA